MQADDFYPDSARTQAIERIRRFLARSGLHSGGVLLVTGLRGSGKTRLVDEALNAQDEPKSNLLQQLIRPLLGRDPIRKRRQQKHFPRGVQRIILPVSIEPFFPCPEEPGSSDDHSLLLEKQREQDVLALLHNVVFALTSFIDARGASYKHGRILGVWVGWLRLWFSPTALYRPQGLPHWLWLLILPVAVCLFGFGLGNWLSGQLGLAALPSPDWLLPGLALTPPIILIAWLWLRWRDLRGLRRMGGKLYDLTHAQIMSKDVRLELNQQLNANMQWQRIPLITLGLLLLGGGGLLSSVQTNLLSILMAIALGGVGAISFIFGIAQQKKQHTTFGVDNKNWMITLLRRYLFQLHRIGFEPVLVMDEIDKLDGTMDETDKLDDASGKGTVRRVPNELQRFEHSLWRLKQSLFAEFLWILIDNGRLAQHLVEARRNISGNELSTLVNVEVFVQPMPYVEFEKYAKTRLSNKFKGYKNWLVHWWVVYRGSVFRLSHTLNQISKTGKMPIGGQQSLDKADINKAKLVQKATGYLTENQMANVAQYAVSGEERVKHLCNLLATSEWHRMWLLNGMLDFAKQLYDPQVIAPSWVDLAKQGEQSALSQREITDNPDTLQHLGAMALLEVLFATWRGDVPEVAGAGNGIDQQAQIRDNYQPLRLVVKT